MMAGMSLPYDPYKAPAAPLDGSAGSGSETVPASVVMLLTQTRPWVRLFSILIFIALGLAGLGFLVMLGIGRSSLGGRMGVGSFIPILIVMGFYIPPAIFLWRYADAIRRLQDGGGMPALEEALTNQKSFWKYVGIFAVVMLCLYALFFAGAMVFGVLLKDRLG
jgi:hypothetical protein